jgi:hypothetical protein
MFRIDINPALAGRSSRANGAPADNLGGKRGPAAIPSGNVPTESDVIPGRAATPVCSLSCLSVGHSATLDARVAANSRCSAARQQ